MLYLIILIALATANACQAAPLEDDSLLEARASLARRTESGCTYQKFTQLIDHFGKHNGTFQQRYSLVTDFFKPGGPILYFQGEESSVLDCVDTTIMYSWAQELNGIAVSLEHRYFGESVPFGATDPTKQPAEFEYLTLDNVMADAASFVEALKENITGAENSKAIVASGSYGGFLATVFRQNHPEAFYGAIASAPPIEGLLNTSSDPYLYDWNIWLNNVYQDRSVEASANIKNAFDVLENRFNSGNVSSLKEELGLCYEPKSTSTDFRWLVGWIQQVYSNSAEFNYATLRPGRASAALPLEKVIGFALNQKDPIQILNETLWMWFGPSPGVDFKCIPFRSPTAGFLGVPLIESIPFSYLTCRYFPLFSLANVPSGTIFPAVNGSVGAVNSCDKAYNLSTPSATELRTQYRYSAEDLRSSTRIIWSLGQYDTTSAVSPNAPGINAPVLSADRNVSRILYTTNMAHREDLFAPDPSDRATVIQARQIELESIKGWLGMYNI